LGALAAYLLREYEQKRQRRRELRGLLRLVSGEITRNARTMDTFKTNPELIGWRPPGALKTRNWEENRVRLAQLMESDKRFETLYNYYHGTALQEEARKWEGSEAERTEAFTPMIRRHELEAERAQKAIRDEMEHAGFDPEKHRELPG
jgi:hypothetical protein